MTTTAIIQARIGSTRLPGKVMMTLAGHPLLWHVVHRVRATSGVRQVVVATSTQPENDEIRMFCSETGIAVFSGSEEDVLDRYYRAATEHEADPIVRVTSDCPLVDPEIIGELIDLYRKGSFDHVGVAIGGGARAEGVKGYPDGLDAACFSYAALERAWREATDRDDREHVTSYMWRNPDRFGLGTLVPEEDYAGLRLTVDEPEDFELVERIYDDLYEEGGPIFRFEEVLALLEGNPELVDLNRHFVGTERYRHLWRSRDAGRQGGTS